MLLKAMNLSMQSLCLRLDGRGGKLYFPEHLSDLLWSFTLYKAEVDIRAGHPMFVCFFTSLDLQMKL